MSQRASDPHRLPAGVVPAHYELELEPNLAAASFDGSERIELDVLEPATQIVLNVKEIELRNVSLKSPGGSTVTPDSVSIDPEFERAVLAFGRTLAPGRYRLEISFSGVLNDKLKGFYRSTFVDEGGAKHAIATTQLESTDARRAFPCFDEPAFKATFGITLVVPEDLFAVSNAPVVSEEPAGNGRKRVRFADTIPMSTYLVAFVVGPFEATPPVDVDGVPLRIVHPAGKGQLAAYALKAGEFALRFFSRYYAIPYPGKKLDMVAIPDFAAGAMENLGCITYREVLLLVDEARGTQAELMRIADVVSHEIAHMWFGDLVTMRWWNGIWLNEAFATFMATLCADAFNPEWRRWDQFGRERTAAFDIDSLAKTRPIEYEVNSPADAEGMFDILTYQKGASVLRMLERYLGEDRFREGIRLYLKKHQYGNTETGDLWDAIEEAAGEPVRRIMDSWIFQAGFPLVSLSVGSDATLEVSQKRFFYAAPPDGAGMDGRWSVPLMIRCFGPDGKRLERRLLESDTAQISAGVRPHAVFGNAGSHGFYRVRYTPELLQALASRMMLDLEPVERYSLVDDTWASVLAGSTRAADLLEFAMRSAGETDLDVWAALSGCLDGLERLLEGAPLERYRRALRSLFRPALERLGWEPPRSRPEPPRVLELRALLVRGLAALAKDPDALKKGRAVHEAYLRDPSSIEPNLAAAAATAVASEGLASDYELFFHRFRTAGTPQEERRYRSLLAVFPGEAEMARTLVMTLDGTIRTQDAPFLLAECLVNRDRGGQAWAFVKRNWDRILREYPDSTIVRMLTGVRALSRPETAADVLSFFQSHAVPRGQRILEQHLEKLGVSLALRERDSRALSEFLLAQEGAADRLPG